MDSRTRTCSAKLGKFPILPPQAHGFGAYVGKAGSSGEGGEGGEGLQLDHPHARVTCARTLPILPRLPWGETP
jgi:hypothetical protein